MEPQRQLGIAARRQSDRRAEDNVNEPAPAFGVFSHGTSRLVIVAEDPDAGHGAQVQIPQHVTGGKGSDQKVFRVVAVRIAKEGRIGRSQNRPLAIDMDLVIAAIGGGRGGWLSSLHHLILPAVVIGLGLAALIARLTRSSTLEVLGQDYVRTARAKGLAGTFIVLKHVL
ncbi:MAG: ABC transporter permease subunit, partial [Bacteroidales bacterium]|nr:ABC transporter permease subunit [Bacteroidales bacterium]